jgi:hypothetical protein
MKPNPKNSPLPAWADRIVAPRAMILGALRFLAFLILFTVLWMQGGMGPKVHAAIIGSANAVLETIESNRSHTIIRYEPDPNRPGQTRAVEYVARNKVKAKFNHRLTYTLGLALALCCFLPHRPWPKALLALGIVAVSMVLLLFVSMIAHAYHVLSVKLANDGVHAADFTETSLLFGVSYMVLPLLSNAAGWWGSGWILSRCKRETDV